MIFLWNTPPMVWNLQNLIRGRNKSPNNIYIHAFDTLFGFALLIVIIKDSQWGMQFAFQYMNWFQDPACKMVGMISIFSLHSSTCTRLFISIEQYIISHNPFQVEERMAKLFIPLHFHWLLPVVLTIMHTVLITPTDNFCSHLVLAPPTWTYLGVLISTLIIDCVMMLTNILLSVMFLRKLHHSRIGSGRQLTGIDKQLIARTVAIMLFNLIFMIIFLTFAIVAMIIEDHIDYTGNVFMMFILPIPTVFDPIIYTLSKQNVLSLLHSELLYFIRTCPTYHLYKLESCSSQPSQEPP